MGFVGELSDAYYFGRADSGAICSIGSSDDAYRRKSKPALMAA
jgi:hypothetical protein